MFLEQEAIAEEQTISSQEQGMTQQGDETYVVESISYAPRFSLLPPSMLFESIFKSYQSWQIAPAYLSMNQPFSILGLTSQARLLLRKTMTTSRMFFQAHPSLPLGSPLRKPGGRSNNQIQRFAQSTFNQIPGQAIVSLTRGRDCLTRSWSLLQRWVATSLEIVWNYTNDWFCSAKLDLAFRILMHLLTEPAWLKLWQDNQAGKRLVVWRPICDIGQWHLENVSPGLRRRRLSVHKLLVETLHIKGLPYRCPANLSSS